MEKNRIDVVGDVAYMYLQDGSVTTFDASEVEWVSQKRWYHSTNVNNPHAQYVAATGRHYRQDGQRYTLYLHRFIMGKYTDIDGALIDHIDRNPLNNTKANLRVANTQLNQLNKRAYGATGNGLLGVYKTVNGKRWRTTLKWDGKTHYIGTYDTPTEAAEAFDRKSVALRGHLITSGSMNYPHRWAEYVADYSGSLGA